MFVLAFQPTPTELRGVRIPDARVEAVDRALTQHRGISIADKHIPDEQVVGIFTEEEFGPLRETFFMPAPVLKLQRTWDEFAQQVRLEKWYVKSKVLHAHS